MNHSPSICSVFLSSTLVLGGLFSTATSIADPVRVEVAKTDYGWQLLHAGKPYFIKGVGGAASRELLVKCGGNSFRTWGTDNLEDQLDEAQRLGLTVTVGFWLGHKRHGFDYHNAKSVQEQFEKVREGVRRYRNHPAVLMWSIGNEMENYEPAGDTAVYQAIEDIATMIKKEDPNHPTMTVFAEVGGDKIALLHKLCPNIDVVGINTYAGGETVAERYKNAGGTKPYVITEFGPLGVWETKKTSWGAAPELTSTAKADWYRRTYVGSISGAKGMCLGSYAFSWGFKREASATWYGMFLPDGTKLAAVDTMIELWTGKPVSDPCPKINSLKLADGDGHFATGAVVRVLLDVAGSKDEPIKVSWELHRDWFEYATGGDDMPEAPQYPQSIIKATDKEAELKMPAEGGGYRLYVYVHGTKGGGAVANISLFVNGPLPVPRARATKLPLVLFGDDQSEAPYVPSGWVGNTGAIGYTPDWKENSHTGKTCLKVEYRESSGWGGIVWQSPANDWGDKAGGFNLTGANKLTFWARGEEGGEKVDFSFGGIRSDKKFHDSADGKVGVELTRDWKQYSIDLSGKDLSCIKSGFGWAVGGLSKPVAFYLDDIRYE
jgi:hypothetical protein